MRPTLQLYVLGEFTLLASGTPISLANSGRAQALLAYSALHGAGELARAQVAFLFWPDATEAQARNNLRQTLFQLRRTWPGVSQYLAVDAHVLGWQNDVDVTVDVRAFERALALAASAERRGDAAGARTYFHEAAELYGEICCPVSMTSG